MKENKKNIRNYLSKLTFGLFLLLAAVLVVANQFGGFMEIGIGSIIAAALSCAILIQCIISLLISVIPIPLAALYFIFQNPLDLPHIPFWTIALVAVLAMVGLSILLPWNRIRGKSFVGACIGGNRHGCDGDAVHFNESGDENNPAISVHFGGVSRYLHAECLESAALDCSFGSLEVFFDKAALSPNGAQARISCKFGSIEMYIPRQWRVRDELSCSLGGVDCKRRTEPDETAPVLTLIGNVSFGSVEVHYV